MLKVSAGIDRFLGAIARVGGWFAVALILMVVWDINTRNYGLPRGFGINATQLQEAEYRAHTIMFSLVIGYAYRRQAHVRIDLLRDRLPLKGKYLIEVAGCLVFLIPYCLVALYFTFNYTVSSFQENEVSKSVIGLTHIWILKAFIPILYALLGLAGISQLIKSIAGLTGDLPDDMISETIGGDS
jgi:TRAP-type mannitol/chloroaromatic compound transport system permease small subunit